MLFEKIDRRTTSEKIVQQILLSIDEGKLQPGDKLPSERELSEMFGVGRAPVREAIRALTLMGYLSVYQGKGAYLKNDMPLERISTEGLDKALAAGDSLELVDIRNLLECKAVALACDRAGDRSLSALKSAVDAMAAGADDVSAFYAADLEFHQALAEASGNAILIEIMNILRARVTQDRESVLGFSGEGRNDCVNTARQVYEAIEKGERELAVRRMTQHLNLVSNELEDILKSAGSAL